ncbi:MAG: metallophosphoesterase family protein [Firmicutes bacterium]|nr:metallophosphoesterase family protein [Bacillota bacterium]
MRLAILGDIHSNIYALEAVLKDVEKHKPDEIICTGDLVGYAPFPNEVIETIKEKGIRTVMGNYDDGIGNFRLVCGCDYKDAHEQSLGEKSIAWTKEQTSEENKEFLRNLPQELRFRAGGFDVLVFHGSPRRLNEYLYQDTDEQVFDEIGRMSRANILIFGHTHIPYHKLHNNRHFINAGSVGKPKHGNPNALYALVDINETVAAAFIEVPYDVEKIARAIEESALPDEFADKLRNGNR